ncbi:MAG: dihydrofolate reductase [Oscillospiraceae bacterium]|nr:dihydrofolate reductase [Oscillospiraceae bacterium]
MITAIAAVSADWGIGKDGDLLFNIPEDKKHFRRTTLNHKVIMGRKTLESLPGGKPFKDRENIVLSRNENFSPEWAIEFTNLAEMMSKLSATTSLSEAIAKLSVITSLSEAAAKLPAATSLSEATAKLSAATSLSEATAKLSATSSLNEAAAKLSDISSLKEAALSVTTNPAIICRNITDTLTLVKNAGDEEIFVAGGGEIYNAMLPYCQKAIITKISGSPEADTFFPNLDKSPEWTLDQESEEQEYEGLKYRFCIYRQHRTTTA